MTTLNPIDMLLSYLKENTVCSQWNHMPVGISGHTRRNSVASSYLGSNVWLQGLLHKGSKTNLVVGG